MSTIPLPGACRCQRTNRPVGPLTGARRFPVPLLALALALAACGSPPPIAPRRPAVVDAAASAGFGPRQRAELDRLRTALADPIPPERSGGLTIRLAYEAGADLDLFVTDPSQESLYFANSPTRSGGELIEDRRCDDPSPRIEVAHFADPIPGRYRVGVDFHRRCEDDASSGDPDTSGLYVVRVDEGGRVLEREGRVVPGHFEVIVLEFDLGAAGGTD